MTEQWFDTNGDGQGDLGLTDTNQDGEVDLLRSDANFNGTLDTFMSDTDKNGAFDWTGVDRNENNLLEGILQDTPGAEDGYADTSFVDNNEDGQDDRAYLIGSTTPAVPSSSGTGTASSDPYAARDFSDLQEDVSDHLMNLFHPGDSDYNGDGSSNTIDPVYKRD